MVVEFFRVFVVVGEGYDSDFLFEGCSFYVEDTVGGLEDEVNIGGVVGDLDVIEG